MSNTDKTRQKLLNSMRKSKNAATTRPVPKTATKRTGSSAKAPVKTNKSAAAAASKKPIQDTGATAKAAPRTGASAPVRGDHYQSGRRVWPD